TPWSTCAQPCRPWPPTTATRCWSWPWRRQRRRPWAWMATGATAMPETAQTRPSTRAAAARTPTPPHLSPCTCREDVPNYRGADAPAAAVGRVPLHGARRVRARARLALPPRPVQLDDPLQPDLRVQAALDRLADLPLRHHRDLRGA